MKTVGTQQLNEYNWCIVVHIPSSMIFNFGDTEKHRHTLTQLCTHTNTHRDKHKLEKAQTQKHRHTDAQTLIYTTTGSLPEAGPLKKLGLTNVYLNTFCTRRHCECFHNFYYKIC